MVEDHWDTQPLTAIEMQNKEQVTLPIPEIYEYNPSANWLLWQPSTGSYRTLDNDQPTRQRTVARPWRDVEGVPGAEAGEPAGLQPGLQPG